MRPVDFMKFKLFCVYFPRLQHLWDIMYNFFRNLSPQRLAILIAVVVVIVGVILTLGLVPASFIYVEYYEVQWHMLSEVIRFQAHNGNAVFCFVFDLLLTLLLLMLLCSYILVAISQVKCMRH